MSTNRFTFTAKPTATPKRLTPAPFLPAQPVARTTNYGSTATVWGDDFEAPAGYDDAVAERLDDLRQKQIERLAAARQTPRSAAPKKTIPDAEALTLYNKLVNPNGKLIHKSVGSTPAEKRENARKTREARLNLLYPESSGWDDASIQRAVKQGRRIYNSYSNRLRPPLNEQEKYAKKI